MAVSAKGNDLQLDALVTFLREVRAGGITSFREGLPEPIHPRRLDSFGLSVRLANCFAERRILIVADLLDYSPRTLSRVPKFGKRCLSELSSILAGICLSELEFDMRRRKRLEKLRLEGERAGNVVWLVDTDTGSPPKVVSNPKPRPLPHNDGVAAWITSRSATDDTKFKILLPPDAGEEVLVDALTSNRLLNCLRGEGIITIADLAEWSVKDLYKIANFGKKTLRELACRLDDISSRYDQVLSDLHRNPEADIDPNLQYQYETPLIEGLHKFLQNLTPREATVLRGRLGFGAEYRTLAELGEMEGVTRERIRQIEAKLMRKLKRSNQLLAVASRVLTQVMAAREIPLPLAVLSRADPYFVGAEMHVIDLRKFVSKLEGSYSVVEVAGELYLLGIDRDEWTALWKGVKLLTDDAAKYQFAVSRLDDEINILASAYGAGYMASVLLDEMLDSVTTSEQMGDLIVVGRRQGINEMIEAVLIEAEGPLHFSAIRAAIERKFGRSLSDHHVSARAGSLERIILLGRGVYGLEKHVRLSTVELNDIREFIENLILESASRQWHSAELIDALSAAGEGPPELDMFRLNFALQRSDSLVYLGRNVWAPADKGVSRRRIDVNDAIVAIVKQADRPLKRREIFEELKERRGVGRFSQVRATREMVCVEPGTWGILGRDHHLPCGVDQFLDELHDALAEFGKGVGPDEMEGLLHSIGIEDPNAAVVTSLATTDDRFGVTAGQVIYLESWGDPRHTSLREHVQRFLEESENNYFLYDDLITYLARRYGKVIDEARLGAVLTDAGVSCSRTSGECEIRVD